MLTFETVNELTLKVTCSGCDSLYTKKGAFIAGESYGQKNYTFEKVLFGPEGNMMQAFMGNMMRRATKENLELMKANLNGDSVTYYADKGKHILVYRLGQGETLSVESENIIAFTESCNYSVRFIGVGVMSQKGMATSIFTGRGPNAYVAISSDGNPIVLSNVQSHTAISVDPDAVICWAGGNYCDPRVTADVNWKTLMGQTSGETYQFEWAPQQPVTVICQPVERSGGIRVGID